MPVRNIKRAFNRIFLIATVVWVIYGAIWWPLHESGRRFTQALGTNQLALQACGTDSDCAATAQKVFKIDVRESQFTRVYASLWIFIVSDTILPPLVAYGVIRGIAALSLWVWHGYKTA